MVADTTEEEQIEALKKWLDDNGTSLVVGIVIVLAVVFGYRTWETNTRETGEAASAIYEELVEAVTVGPIENLSDDKISTGRFLGDQLKQDHEGSTYTHFASLHLAKVAVEKGDLDAAAAELQWVLDNDADDKIAVIANYRLAKVKYGQADYDGAIAQLDSRNPGGHLSSYEELRGDILYELDRLDEAREAYQRAINAQAEFNKPFTQMKLDDLVAPMVDVSVDDADGAESTDGNGAGDEDNQ